MRIFVKCSRNNQINSKKIVNRYNNSRNQTFKSKSNITISLSKTNKTKILKIIILKTIKTNKLKTNKTSISLKMNEDQVNLDKPVKENNPKPSRINNLKG